MWNHDVVHRKRTTVDMGMKLSTLQHRTVISCIIKVVTPTVSYVKIYENKRIIASKTKLLDSQYQNTYFITRTQESCKNKPTIYVFILLPVIKHITKIFNYISSAT
jgi:hypothetical protein